jgi:caa(3)-type oxidase subunit IV
MSKTPNVSHDEHRPNVGLYVKVFAALMVLTMVTVIISRFHLPRPQAIGLGLFVAVIKASLVGALFMHLWGENKLIHNALWITVSAAAILLLPMIDCVLIMHKMTAPADVAAQHPHEGAHEEATEPINIEPASPPATLLPKKKAGH